MGTDSAAFLNIPVGAGPAALGSAYSALAADAYAPVWNPAGLGFLNSTQIAGQHVAYLDSIHYEFLSVVHPLRPGSSVGFSAQYVGSGDIDATDRSGNSMGSYSDNFGAYSLAYGNVLTDRLSMGVTGKLIHMQLSDVSANAYAADLGGLWRATNHLNIAAVLTNAGSQAKFLNSSDPLPLAFRAGAAYASSVRWLWTGEVSYAQTGLTGVRGGVEFRAIKSLVLRTGYRTDNLNELSALAGLSMGLGIQLWNHEFAYAWVPYGALGNSQYFSLVLRFGAPKEVSQNMIQYQYTEFGYIVPAFGVPKDQRAAQPLEVEPAKPQPAKTQPAQRKAGSPR